jgi:hypothetical protein
MFALCFVKEGRAADTDAAAEDEPFSSEKQSCKHE